MDACPCGDERGYDRCCGALHRGERTAVTAVELMRSRYAAFAVGAVDYLAATHVSAAGESERRTELAESMAGTRWSGLEVLDVVRGAAGDDVGVVEFEARYVAGGRAGSLKERSRFRRVDGRWMYVDAVDSVEMSKSGAGRNDPCPCGTGLKFKKCCGGRPAAPAKSPSAQARSAR